MLSFLLCNFPICCILNFSLEMYATMQCLATLHVKEKVPAALTRIGGAAVRSRTSAV